LRSVQDNLAYSSMAPEYSTLSLATRLEVLHATLNTSPSAILELRQLICNTPPDRVVAAAGDTVLCSVLAETSKELAKCKRSTPGEGFTVADQHAARCFHAFAALLSIIAGDTASPTLWTVHVLALPFI